MLPFLAFIIRNQFWILALCGLGVVWYLAQFITNSRQLGRSSFYLEQERAKGERMTAFYWLFLFVIVAAGTVFIGRNYTSQIPAELLNPATPTPNALVAPPPTATVPPRITRNTELPTPTADLAPTITPFPGQQLLAPAAAETSTPRPSLIVQPLKEGCDDTAIIREPASGATITGGMSIFGKAMGAEFSYYRFDAIGPFTENAWQPLVVDVYSEAVVDGFLASADMSGWDDGIYQVRLNVFNTSNSLIGSCLIQIGVLN